MKEKNNIEIILRSIIYLNSYTWEMENINNNGINNWHLKKKKKVNLLCNLNKQKILNYMNKNNLKIILVKFECKKVLKTLRYIFIVKTFIIHANSK